MILNYSNFLNPSPSYPVLSHLGSNSPFLASHFQLGHCKFSVTGSGLVYCGVLKARQETDSHGNWESCSEIHVIGVLHMCMASISTKQANDNSEMVLFNRLFRQGTKYSSVYELQNKIYTIWYVSGIDPPPPSQTI